ncbi:MAG: ornithine cyclodeaminase [Gammaproteobacteria bacterium]|jgi:ornithine cyclodeaminase
MKLITAKDISQAFNDKMIKVAFEALTNELKRWQEFKKCPRHAIYYPHGVFELMPCSDNQYYGYKYVNCHPANPKQHKSSVVATGMLVDIETGYPLMFCDMTLLTAIRTAATSAIAAKYLADPGAGKIGLIGTGAQAEFQILWLSSIFNIDTVKFFDVDSKAMEKLQRNIDGKFKNIIACKNAFEVTQDIDILTTAINTKEKVKLVEYDWVKDNHKLFINAIGGDCPGKTEMDVEIVKNSRIVVEFFPQTRVEGEIQNLEHDPEYTELWELVQQQKPGRTDQDKIILFDSVGFALADFAIMKMVYEQGLGSEITVLPDIPDPKDLYAAVR